VQLTTTAKVSAKDVATMAIVLGVSAAVLLGCVGVLLWLLHRRTKPEVGHRSSCSVAVPKFWTETSYGRTEELCKLPVESLMMAFGMPDGTLDQWNYAGNISDPAIRRRLNYVHSIRPAG